MKKGLAVIYDRASGEQQKDNWSRADALRIGTELAQKHGYSYELRQEIKSGESLVNRPIMQSILTDIEAGSVHAIVCQDLIRLSRDEDTIDGLVIRQTCREYGVPVITQSKVYDFGNEHDDLSADMEFLMGKLQKRASNKQTIRGIREKAKQGGFLGGYASIGYKLVYTQENKAEKPKADLAIDNDYTHIVKEAFELYIEQGGRLTANELNRRGYRKPNGKRFSGQNILLMIPNPIYAGFYTWGKKAKSRWLKDFEAPMHFRPELQIVPIELWQQANDILKERSQGKTGARAKHPFSGIVACPHCNGPMYGRYSHGRINYACYRADRYGDCQGKKYSGRIISQAIIPFLADILIKESISSMLEDAAQEFGKSFSEAELEQRIKAELATIKEAKQRVIKAISTGLILEEEAKNELDELRAKEQRLSRDLLTIADKETIKRDYLQAIEALKQVDIEQELRLMLEKSPNTLRQIVRMVIEPASIKISLTGKAKATKAEIVDFKFTEDFLSISNGTFCDNRLRG